MYLFKDYFNSADMLSLVGFAGVLPMLALAPFAAKLSKRFGKKRPAVWAWALPPRRTC